MNLEFKNIDIIDTIKDVVTSMDVEQHPNFMYGHIKEIANTLRELSKNKYPLIIMPLDVTGSYIKNLNAFKFENVTIYIVAHTEPTYTAEQLKNLVFNPFLIPLYEAFINSIKCNKSINNGLNIPFIEHKKTDRFFWGSSLNSTTTQNVVGDYLDCIELNFNSIIINNKNC